MRELLRTAPEVFSAHAACVLPLAFGAKMDEDSEVAAAWKEVRTPSGCVCVCVCCDGENSSSAWMPSGLLVLLVPIPSLQCVCT